MDTEKKITSIEERLARLESRKDGYLSREAGALDKKIINEIVADSVHNTLWDWVSYTSSFASASITTTTSEVLDSNGRESDTSQGRRFNPARESRFRVSFYLDAGISKSTVYITTAVSSSSAIGTSIIDANKSFVGVKIVAGAVSAVSSIAGSVTSVSTVTTISTNATNVLEIDYYISHAVIRFNEVVIGDISCNLQSIATETFFPFLISLGSSDGTSVNITTESFEFLQKRK